MVTTQKVKWAEEKKYDAVIIDCFIDVALDAARELVNIPVVGACQSSCSLAARMGGNFSIISVLRDIDRTIRANLAKYGLIYNLVSIPVVDISVLDLQKNFDQVVEKILDLAKRNILEEGAHTLVFGCTGMSPVIDQVKRQFESMSIKVPVIEPLRAAVCDAINCVLMGVSQSKKAYRPIRSKKRIVDWKI